MKITKRLSIVFLRLTVLLRTRSWKALKELNRIYRGPHQGLFTLLHHNNYDIIEPSEDVMERIAYIVLQKPSDQIYTRLKNIAFVPDSMRPGPLKGITEYSDIPLQNCGMLQLHNGNALDMLYNACPGTTFNPKSGIFPPGYYANSH